MAKYYFVTYITKRLGRQFFDNDVIDEHPFQWLSRSQNESNSKKVLVNWREISEEEFRLYNHEECVEELDQALESQPSPLEMISRDPSDGLLG